LGVFLVSTIHPPSGRVSRSNTGVVGLSSCGRHSCRRGKKTQRDGATD